MPFKDFDRAFDALAAANSQTRLEMQYALAARVQSWAVSPDAAAARLGISLARLHEFMRGELSNFSTGALVQLAAAAGLRPHDQRGTGRK